MGSLSRYGRPSLTLLAEMAIMPNLADTDIERVRKLRLERLRQLRDHAPALAERAMARLLYGTHPYGHLSLGSETALGATTADDLRRFQRGAFVPASTVLTISGDGDVDELVDMADMAFGAWEAAGGESTVDAQAGLQPPPREPAHALAIVARARLRAIGAAHRSRLRVARHARLSRAVVLNMILGGQFVSRVNLNLRQDKGYTYGVRTGFDLRRGLGPFSLQTSVQSDKTVPAIREASREIADIRGARPATADELGHGQASITLGLSARLRDRAAGRARRRAARAARSAGHLFRRVRATRSRQSRWTTSAASRIDYLDLSRMATLIVGDPDRIGPELATLGEAASVTP